MNFSHFGSNPHLVFCASTFTNVVLHCCTTIVCLLAINPWQIGSPRATPVSIGLVCASLVTQILLHPKSIAIYEPNFVIKHIDNFYHFPFHILAIAYLIYLCAIVVGKSVCVIILCVCYFPVTLVNILIHVHAWHCSNDVKTATRRMFA